MTWARIDDGAWCHPKILAAGNEAIGVWIRAIAWSCQHLTDGVITASALTMICPEPQPWESLITAGLVTPTGDGGATLHDFLAYNPSRAEVLARRDQAQKRAKKASRARWDSVKESTAYASKHQSSMLTSIPTRIEQASTPACSGGSGSGSGSPSSAREPFPKDVDLCAVAAAPAERRKPRTVKTVLPSDWKPSNDHYDMALNEGGKSPLWVDHEAAALRDWATAKGARYVSWDAMFRTWIRRSLERPNGTPPRRGPAQTELPAFRPGDETREF